MAVWTDQLGEVQPGRRCLGTTVQARKRSTVSRVRADRPERSASTKCTRLHTQRTSRCSRLMAATARTATTAQDYRIRQLAPVGTHVVPCVHASLPPSTAYRSVRPFLQRSMVCTTHRQTTRRHGICSNSPHYKLRMRCGLKSVRLYASTDSAVGP